MVSPTLLIALLWALFGFATCADKLGNSTLNVNLVPNALVNVNESKIVSGQVSRATHPWIGEVYYLGGSAVQYACTVSLFTTKMGLTSAHCFDETIGRRQENSLWMLKVGSHRSFEGTNVRVAAIIRHPQYVRAALATNGRYNIGSHDLAAVVLETVLHFIPRVQLIGIAPGYFQSDGFLFSFGRIESNRLPVPGDELRFTPLELAPTSDCNFGNNNDPTAVCWNTGAGKACRGDSGGPAMYYEADMDQTEVVFGVLSYGDGSCNSHYVACTNLQEVAIHDWVRDQITRHT